jgi:F-type H+-transporting ATPase subunit epsilon
MNTFVMHLYGSTQYERIEGVTSFVEQDDSGSFGIQAGHARMMTALSYGLARYRNTNNVWVYLALPGGLLYFVNNELHITTRRYFVDTDYQRISTTLLDQLLREEEELYSVKQTLSRLEQETLRRLWQMEQGVT